MEKEDPALQVFLRGAARESSPRAGADTYSNATMTQEVLEAAISQWRCQQSARIPSGRSWGARAGSTPPDQALLQRWTVGVHRLLVLASLAAVSQPA